AAEETDTTARLAMTSITSDGQETRRSSIRCRPFVATAKPTLFYAPPRRRESLRREDPVAEIPRPLAPGQVRHRLDNRLRSGDEDNLTCFSLTRATERAKLLSPEACRIAAGQPGSLVEQAPPVRGRSFTPEASDLATRDACFVA